MSDIGMTVGLIKALAPSPEIDPADIEQSVSDWLDDHPEATTTVEDGSITMEKLDADLQAEIEKKADNDGLYEQMTVGNAEQLVATVGVEDKVPYNFRTAGGSADIGDRETDMIVGGTIAWNQLLSSQNAVSGYTKFDITIYAVSNKFAFTANGTFNYSSGDRNLYIFNQISGEKMLAGHKYLITNTSKYFCAYIYGAGTPAATLSGNRINVNNQGGTIIACSAEGGYRVSLHCGTNIANNTAIDETIYINLYDLTQMFGSTIADYIYNLETATPGAGVAWFRKLFPKNYYAYDAGSLQSVQAKSHKTVGFNAIDATLAYQKSSNNVFIDPIPVVPGQVYELTSDALACTKYVTDFDRDILLATISSQNTAQTFTVPDNCTQIRLNYYLGTGITVATVLAAKPCLHLVWDGERDGEYEAYDEHVYPLDDSLTLRGIPKLDANNNLYYDGDTYESDGTVTRRFAELKFGTDITSAPNNWFSADETKETWGFYYNYNSSGVQVFPYNVKAGQVISDKFTKVSSAYGVDAPYVMSAVYTTGTAGYIAFRIPKSAIATPSDSADLTSKLVAWIQNNPFTVVAELATPTTESADPYQNPQIVDDFGTEEYIDAGVTASTPTRDVAIPVGHETTYQANLRAKLEMAPESPDGDGDYIVRQTNGQNEYVELVIPTELPTAPTTDGNYVLKCTVSNGTATYAWEVQS